MTPRRALLTFPFCCFFRSLMERERSAPSVPSGCIGDSRGTGPSSVNFPGLASPKSATSARAATSRTGFVRRGMSGSMDFSKSFRVTVTSCMSGGAPESELEPSKAVKEERGRERGPATGTR